MVTKEQALTESEFHYNGCTRTVGPRGGVSESISRARRNGSTQTWKRTPEAFRMPVKIGFRDHDAITNYNADNWHVASDCPLYA